MSAANAMLVILVSVVAMASGTSYEAIAGYIPGSNVSQHNHLDLDQAAMEAALATLDWTTAMQHYSQGGSSKKSNGSFRTIQGFSTGAQSKMYSDCPGCPYMTYSKFYSYFGNFDYADMFVSAALTGTLMSWASGNHGPNDFGALGDEARVEAVKKGSVYMNVWMYVIRELEDAYDDCMVCPDGTNCNPHSHNGDSVHALDEAVAFYTGSLEGTSGSQSGKLLYRLADKRCENFGTCGRAGDATSGTSQVNVLLFEKFELGKILLGRGRCADMRPIIKEIVSLMTVPLVQGSLRYAYKVGEVSTERSQKNAAEGATFSAAVLPLVHACDADAAQTISDNLKFGSFDAGVYPDFTAVKLAFESTYECLGITCAQVGGLVDSSGNPLAPSTAACTVSPTRMRIVSSANTDWALVGGCIALGLLLFFLLFLAIWYFSCRTAKNPPSAYLASTVPVAMQASATSATSCSASADSKV